MCIICMINTLINCTLIVPVFNLRNPAWHARLYIKFKFYQSLKRVVCKATVSKPKSVLMSHKTWQSSFYDSRTCEHDWWWTNFLVTWCMFVFHLINSCYRFKFSNCLFGCEYGMNLHPKKIKLQRSFWGSTEHFFL